ncbi:MAG: DUF2330 domain-containing protein [Deltaproteobacteria bacterium]|nr:DUF2330 domain-containing protein [Nannocystaceae bacterium]
MATRVGSIMVAASAWAVWPADADACGGTFCDASGPNPPTVDQAAETVLFVQDGPWIEAHVQIVIDPNTDATKFAWLVPMPSVPELSVGSQPLFDALLAGSSPRFTTTGGSCYQGDVSGGDEGYHFDIGGVDPPDVQTEVIGAFEASILAGGNVDGVLEWLADNGYAQDEAAEPIIADYLSRDFVMVAFKLAPNADVGEIHPVVLRHQSDEPCVPLELTAIAAQDDMGVRTLFLGEQRWAPLNYRHVVPNPLRMPWVFGESSYPGAIAMAVDEASAGHGFVTEYAGPSEVVDDTGLYDARWSSMPFATAAAIEVVDLLNAQGLADCTEGFCSVPHPLVVALLGSYLPVPEGVNGNDFYACLSCYVDQTEFTEWDGPAFAADLQTRVIEPAAHASELLASWPYLTRMFTAISPHEMTLDPMFHVNAELPDVPLAVPVERSCRECDSATIMHFPGRELVLPYEAAPQFGDDMPWAERVEMIPENGAPIVELDRGAEIDAALIAWNEQQVCGGRPGGTTGDTTDGTPGDGGDGTGSASGSGDAGQDGGSAEDSGQPARGCGCESGSSRQLAGGWACIVLVLGVRRRRG